MEDNRGEAIRVRGVVVVGIATAIHVPRIIRIAAVSRTQTDNLSFNLHPIYFYFTFEYLLASDSCHFAIRTLVSFTSSDQ